MPYDRALEAQVDTLGDPLWPEEIGESTYLTAPDDEEQAVECAQDPTAPPYTDETEEKTKQLSPRRRGPILSEAQQRQVALWIVEGFTYKETKSFMERDWGFSITEAAWRYYRNVRSDLIAGAVKFLRDSYMKFGYAERGVRLAKLVKHAKRLEYLLDTEGLFTTDVQEIKWSNRSEVVSRKQFNAHLSREYRDTIAQIDKLVGPVERAISEAEGGITINLGQDVQRFVEAAQWHRSQEQLAAGE